ncbi:hypothetical protein CRV24_007814 [Beauveria bassiana]|nr:hypothetical protein CRV24_007814 [Beauveria bassiana]
MRPGPPEPEPVPEGEQIDCSGKVDDTIKEGRKLLEMGFGSDPHPKFKEGVEEAIRVFKKTLGCKEQAEVMARGI